MKYIRDISRYLVGIVFIFSGFVKGIDPMGSTYKFSDYFTAFHMGFLEPIALPLAFLLSAMEFIIGFNLFLGIRMKLTSWLTLIFMSFFTILTFILALTNPVTDCGCFGDALILTNWQTFAKNIVLLALTLIIFYQRNRFTLYLPIRTEWGTLLIALAAFVLLESYSYRHLPVIDFRPYHTGADIQAGMKIPEGAAKDEYQTFLYYKKNGEVKQFTMENYPWDDSTWTWVDTKSVLVKRGYIPPIHDFSIITWDNNNITSHVLNDKGYSFLFISHNLNKADKKAFDVADQLSTWCQDHDNVSFYPLTASTGMDIKQFKAVHPIDYNFYTTDETTLKTIIRANPGLVLIRDGVILQKWHYNDFPSLNELGGNLLSSAIIHQQKTHEKLVYLLFFAGVFLYMLLIKAFFRRKRDTNHQQTRVI